MKITIESTTKIVEIRQTESGALSRPIPARIWEGHTESGIAVHCYVTRIAVAPDKDQRAFERELQTCRAPSPEVEALPARMIL